MIASRKLSNGGLRERETERERGERERERGRDCPLLTFFYRTGRKFEAIKTVWKQMVALFWTLGKIVFYPNVIDNCWSQSYEQGPPRLGDFTNAIILHYFTFGTVK